MVITKAVLTARTKDDTLISRDIEASKLSAEDVLEAIKDFLNGGFSVPDGASTYIIRLETI